MTTPRPQRWLASGALILCSLILARVSVSSSADPVDHPIPQDAPTFGIGRQQLTLPDLFAARRALCTQVVAALELEAPGLRKQAAIELAGEYRLEGAVDGLLKNLDYGGVMEHCEQVFPARNALRRIGWPASDCVVQRLLAGADAAQQDRNQALIEFIDGRAAGRQHILDAMRARRPDATPEQARRWDELARTIRASLSPDMLDLEDLVRIRPRSPRLGANEVRRMLQAEDLDLVTAALRHVREDALSELLPEVLRVQSSADSPVELRRSALDTIACLRTPQVLPVLLANLKDRDVLMRRIAIMGLGNLRDRRAVPALLPFADPRGHPGECLDALFSLGALGDDRAIPAVQAAIDAAPTDKIRQVARDALTRLQQKDRPLQ